MPFSKENAGKHGHSAILNNPDVKLFLDKCSDVEVPTKEELESVIDQEFHNIEGHITFLPKLLLAIDGSSYESYVEEEYPSRQLGYIKISSVLLNLSKYESIAKDNSTKFINPFEVAKLQKETDTLSLALPGAYVRLPECETITESFRKSLLDYMQGETTKLGGKTLYSTLVILIDYLGRLHNDKIVFTKCPTNECHKSNGISDFKIELDIHTGIGTCPICNQKAYASDALRIFEEFSETESNGQSFSRTMSFFEHLLGVHYIVYLWKNNLKRLSETCIFLDGPLAIFGPSAPFHNAIMKLLDNIRDDANKKGFEEPLIMGISKTGRIYEHFMKINKIKKQSDNDESIQEFIPRNSFFIISDEYRYKYIDSAQKNPNKNFGQETYYGQDIFIKTKSGNIFVICLAYPFKVKETHKFQKEKLNINHYKKLGQALTVIKELESDLYDNAVIPIVLAHKHTSISLKPGGKVLDILTSNAFKD